MKHEAIAIPRRGPGRPRTKPRPVRLRGHHDPRLAALEAKIIAGEMLTIAESEELYRLIANEASRRRRLPKRVQRQQTALEALVDELAPSDRLKFLRRAMIRARDRYLALLEALDPGAHLAAIERELATHPQPHQGEPA